MKALPTPLPGLTIVEFDRHLDARGGFERVWCSRDFAAAGLRLLPQQISLSTNPRAGTLRGLHWSAGAPGETKLVRVTRGAIFDVAVDLRPDSPTRARWFGLELDATVPRALLIPAGFAHGFITLADDSDVLYAIDELHEAELARGARWDDPAFGIVWPRAPVTISDRDRAWPDWRP